MEIIGHNFNCTNSVSYETLLCRKAWEMLRAFGDEMIHEIEIQPSFHEYDDDEEAELFESTETEYIKFGEFQEFSVVIDQYPFIEGKMCSDIGYVALHVRKHDDYDEIEEEQQIVFMQEAHPDGPKILIGNNNDLRVIQTLDEILEVDSFLEYIKIVAWNWNLNNPFSYINMYPQSDLLREINSMLFSEEDNI